MSTIIHVPFSQSEIDRCLELERWLRDLRKGRDLLLPGHLGKRLNALDELDAILGDLDPDALEALPEPELIARAMALRSQLEAANEMVFQATRDEIAVLGNSPAMHHWLMELASDGDTERPRPGLRFDLLDDFVSGVLELQRPGGTSLLPSPEMTAYQPTPVRRILDLIAASNFSSDDVLVDLGSGLGHVSLLVSILTGIRTLGIEVQPSLVASARGTARDLNLRRVRFRVEDARMTDLSIGSVFYMFSPFRGSILADVLCQLRKQSRERSIRIGSLGPCTRVLEGQTWLRATEHTETERIAVFKSL